MAHLLLYILQLFMHFRGKHQVDYCYRGDFGGHLSFLINFFTLTCFTFFQWVEYNITAELTFKHLQVETNFCIQRLDKSFQNVLLHFVIFKTILLLIFGIITGLKICQLPNTCINWMGLGYHFKSFNTLFQPMLNYCRKFGDVKLNTFEDMIL